MVEQAVGLAAGHDFWRLDELTLWYVVGLLVVQVVAREIFKRYGPFKSDAALAAHQVCSMLCISHCGFWGIYYWLGEAGTVEDRLYGPTVGALFIGQVNLAFQFYDLLATAFIGRLRKPEMLVHHTLACMMCYFLMRDCYVHYYAIFFLGISEVSSFPLVFVDVFKFFPDTSARFPRMNGLLRIAFALLFILLRVVCWFFVAAAHLWDTIQSFKAGKVHDFGVVGFFTVCNLTLTVLQWYWGYLIVRAAANMISGKKDGKKSKPKAA